MKKIISTYFLLQSAILLGGCADKSANIQESYVSPLAYNSYDCESLEQEYSRVIRKSQSINKQQDDIASNDSVAMGVGLVLFWPALFFIDNDDVREQVAQLKGEVDAIDQAANQKKCFSLSNSIDEAKKASAEAEKATAEAEKAAANKHQLTN